MARAVSAGTSLLSPPGTLSSCQSISLCPAGLGFVRLLKHRRAFPSGLALPVSDPRSLPTIRTHAISKAKRAHVPFSPCAPTANATPETTMPCSASPASSAPSIRSRGSGNKQVLLVLLLMFLIHGHRCGEGAHHHRWRRMEPHTDPLPCLLAAFNITTS